MGKFNKRKEICPVVLLVIAEYSEVLFNFLVDSFCFSICLGMESCGEGLIDPEFLPSFLHNLRSKLGSSV